MSVTLSLANARQVRDVLRSIRAKARVGQLPHFLSDEDFDALQKADFVMMDAMLFADDGAELPQLDLTEA